MKIKITNIDWDTDGENPNLPKEEIMTINDEYIVTTSLEDDILDYLSDKHGWCINYCDYEIVDDNVIKPLIDSVMINNYCEDDPQQYVRYLERDLDRLVEMKEKQVYSEDWF